MKKPILYLSLTAALASSSFAAPRIQSATTVKNDFPNVFRPIGRLFKRVLGIKPKPIVEYTSNVNDVNLSRTEIVASCSSERTTCSKNQAIEVSTVASSYKNEGLIYLYTISGGRIIGKDAKVVWDLSGVAPGTYTITAGVDDGCGVCGKTFTKEIKVVECADCKKDN